ncbi:MAG TPA: hypothetical protein VGP76_13040 [Planctomycetaceae bacterium]|jgi:hypothetical protein|nr:hypothetical protein [Planctomycetaceae bacterium]
MKANHQRFALTLESKGSSTVPTIQRLKHLLKVLGRSHGFRAVKVLEVSPTNTEADVNMPDAAHNSSQATNAAKASTPRRNK